MSQLNRILAQDALERNLLLENSRISVATWSNMSQLPQKVFSQVDEDLIKEHNEQFPSQEMNPENDLELDAIPPDDAQLGVDVVEIDGATTDMENLLNDIRKSFLKCNEDRKIITAAYNAKKLTRNEWIKQQEAITKTIATLKNQQQDVENHLIFLNQRKVDIKKQYSEQEAEKSRINAKNKERTEIYRQEKNLLNRGANVISQQPDESEEQYINRLQSNAAVIAPEEALFNSKIMIQRTFREKLKELVRSDAKIDQIANVIDPIDEVKNKHDIIKYWTRFKSQFLDLFGTKPNQLSANDVVNFMHMFLGDDKDETDYAPNAAKVAGVGKSGTHVEIRNSGDKDVAELYNPEENKSLYFRIISPVAPQTKVAKLVLLYSFTENAPKGSCEQYMEMYLAKGQERASKIIRDETGITSADLKALGLSDHPDVIAKNLFKAHNISITNDFTSGLYETAHKKERKEVFGYGVGGSVLPRYADFGKILILLRKLYLENILSIRWKSKTNVAGFTHVKVSEDFVQIILNMMQGNSPTRMDICNLTTQERHLYDRLISIAMLQKQMVHTSPKSVNDLKKRLKLIEGEIEAGNNNPDLVKEIKQVLLSLQHLGVITKSQINSYLKQF